MNLLNKNQMDMLQALPDYPKELKMLRSEYDEFPGRFGLARNDLQILKSEGILEHGYVGPGAGEPYYFLKRGANAADAEREYREHIQEQEWKKRTDRRNLLALVVSFTALISSIAMPLILRALG